MFTRFLHFAIISLLSSSVSAENKSADTALASTPPPRPRNYIEMPLLITIIVSTVVFLGLLALALYALKKRFSNTGKNRSETKKYPTALAVSSATITNNIDSKDSESPIILPKGGLVDTPPGPPTFTPTPPGPPITPEVIQIVIEEREKEKGLKKNLKKNLKGII